MKLLFVLDKEYMLIVIQNPSAWLKSSNGKLKKFHYQILFSQWFYFIRLSSFSCIYFIRIFVENHQLHSAIDLFSASTFVNHVSVLISLSFFIPVVKLESTFFSIGQLLIAGIVPWVWRLWHPQEFCVIEISVDGGAVGLHFPFEIYALLMGNL